MHCSAQRLAPISTTKYSVKLLIESVEDQAVIDNRRCAYPDHEGERYVPIDKFHMRRRKGSERIYYHSYCSECEKKRHKEYRRQKRLEKGLPVKPLANYIEYLLENGHTSGELAEVLGVDPKHVRAIIRRAGGEGQRTRNTITVDYADKVMVALGGPFSVYSVYPELRE